MKLVIVESPAKAKTIEKYLGSGFTVRASVGHVRDLPKTNKDAVDIAGGFIPHYQIVKEKQLVINDLKREAKKSDEVILATDPDREGEAIAWHLAQALELTDPKRIVFHEITQKAILEAMQHPRLIDQDLRKAQEARRVLDRLFGYDLSGLVWKKVRYGLSAGRVQSPALRIIMEREREIRAFVPVAYWIIEATLKTAKNETIVFTCVEEPSTAESAERIVKTAQTHDWHVTDVEAAPTARAPKAPFTTSTLQQAASTRLGFSPSRTMGAAQKLYEAGFITYMRTDSTTLSQDAQTALLSIIKEEYGDKYVEARVYKTKSKNAQEAHEPVRPTNSSKHTAGNNEDQKRLYQLIRARTLASQMSDASVMRTKITANVIGASRPNFTVNGSRVIFDGWLKADPDARGEDVELPAVAIKSPLQFVEAHTEGKETQPPGRYSEAGLVKELEKRGIGRPSTYASIIRTLDTRGYVEKQGRTLIPTPTGDVVSTFIENNFGEYISDTFTAKMEDDLDEIATGTRDYAMTLKEFYSPFTIAVKAKNDIPKITGMGDVSGEFKCPICNGEMEYKLSKNGRFMSCKKFPECVGARREDGTEIEPPKDIGEACPECGDADKIKSLKKGKKKLEPGRLIMRDGRFGSFIACSNYPKCKFVRKDPEEEAKSKTGVTCPTCGKGEMVERRGRFGVFYSCSSYPACKNAIKAKPTGSVCKMCGSLMMEGTKTIPERCSNKTCKMHNPHKM